MHKTVPCTPCTRSMHRRVPRRTRKCTCVYVSHDYLRCCSSPLVALKRTSPWFREPPDNSDPSKNLYHYNPKACHGKSVPLQRFRPKAGQHHQTPLGSYKTTLPHHPYQPNLSTPPTLLSVKIHLSTATPTLTPTVTHHLKRPRWYRPCSCTQWAWQGSPLCPAAPQ